MAVDETVLQQAQQLLEQSNADMCVRHLASALGLNLTNNNGSLELSNSNSQSQQEDTPPRIRALHLLGEALLDLGEAQTAYPVFLECARVDGAGEMGADKFLWLGQLTGGRQGLEWYGRGVARLQQELEQASTKTPSDPPTKNQISRKLAEARCGMIEIYMTDLCMEPEAEHMCEQLIEQAIQCDERFPENWNVLGSIRISQQRDDEAREALDRAWQLYQEVVDGGEGAGNQAGQDSSDEADINPSSMLEETVPSLIRLAQSMTELQMFEAVVDVTALLSRIDDQIADAFYLNGLAHVELAQAAETGAQGESHKRRAVRALTTLAQTEGADPEMVQAGQELLASVGPVDTTHDSDSEGEELEELGFGNQ